MKVKITLLLIVFWSINSLGQGGDSFTNIDKAGWVYEQFSSAGYNNQFVGFTLKDVEKGHTIIDYNGDKYFTPASNTKILTLYTAMKLLPDSIPAFRYTYIGKDLHIEGTGDPTFLHPSYNSDRVISFLKKHEGNIILHWNNFDDLPMGNGWSWEDYDKDFSPERSAFPMYGNLVTISKTKSGGYYTKPSVFSKNITMETGLKYRAYNDNIFYANSSGRSVPFLVKKELIQNVLEEVTGKTVSLSADLLPKAAKVFYSHPADSIYKRMMENSDNFIADQLLLQASGMIGTKLKTAAVINHVLSKYFTGMPHKPVWEDGSGLSRYNLFTPQDMTYILTKLYNEFPQERLFNIFAVGGRTGTIKGRYSGNPPYVYAKTGTLSNNYCLSGYLVANSGRVLAFSFMHNHYTKPINTIKTETEKVLKYIRDNY